MRNKHESSVYTFGNCRLNSDGRLELDGEEVPLTPTLLEILYTLIDDAGRVVGKGEFLDRVWPGRVVEEGNLARNVSTLRRLLDDDPRQPRYIETIPGRGYRLVAKVVARSPDDVSAAQIPAASSRQASWLTAPFLTLVAVIAGALLVSASSYTMSDFESRPGAAIRSLVVLPLENLSGDANQDYLADGLTEELISALGSIEALSVTSRRSAMQYRDSSQTLPEIASELGVQGVVEGGVVRADDSVRLSVRLVDAATDRAVWSQSFDRSQADTAALHSDIALAIAKAIDVEIAPEQTAVINNSREVSEKAHEAWLLGLFFRNKATLDSLHTAIGYFEQAIEAEPEFAEAYAEMADAYMALASWQGPAREYWPMAIASANAAIEIDNTVAAALVVRAGAILCHDLDAVAAEPTFLRALELNPGNSKALARYSYDLMAQGRFDESIEWMREALRVDPAAAILNEGLATRYHFARRYDEAIAQARHTLALQADYAGAHHSLGLTYLQIGEIDAAIAALEKSLELSGGIRFLGDLGHAYALAGRTDDAMHKLQQLEDLSDQGKDASYSIALIHYGLGNIDDALLWLDRAHGERDFRMIYLPTDPIWDNLRSEPRFEALLRRIGLRSIPIA